MSRLDRILCDELELEGLSHKYLPDGLMWRLITKCMSTAVTESEEKNPELTIGEIVEINKATSKNKRKRDHEHQWLHCGSSVYVCDNCPKYEVR